MKIVTYNIRFGLGLDHRYDLERIAAEIDGADIIGLQEVERFWRRSGMVDQPQRIGELFKSYYWAYCPAFDVNASSENANGSVTNRRRQFGPMVLSRWPILSSRSLALPQFPANNLISMATGAIECVIDTPLGPLRVYSLHLSALSPRERLLQIDALLETNRAIEHCGRVIMAEGNHSNPAESEHINGLDWNNGEPALPIPAHTVFLGDFNCTPESREFNRFVDEPDPIFGYGVHSDSLVDSWLAARQTTGDPESWWPDPPDRLPGKPLRLDYCFISSPLASKINHCWVDNKAVGSDHRPYWIELDE
ncbi:MAG: endonuclease/exonuclease/phosphatase family metal-dependent hydrolase [Gammaproteobacteria bacterium]|jgi:endonuclease/exonuclease/phosphatase family metal-dependent hydrolase